MASKISLTARIGKAAQAELGAFLIAVLGQVSPRNQLSFDIKYPPASESSNTPRGPGGCP